MSSGQGRVHSNATRQTGWLEGGDTYLKSSILVELGGRNVTDPNERHIISPDISKLVTGLDLPSGEVVVLSPERTFWEKATLITKKC